MGGAGVVSRLLFGCLLELNTGTSICLSRAMTGDHVATVAIEFKSF